MKKAVVLLGILILALAAFAGWQIAACWVANSELQSDMRDLAVQNRARIGLVPFSSEQELRNAVIASASKHGISLEPEQVTVKRTLTPEMLLSIYVAADYEARVKLLGVSFPIHFTPSSLHSAVIVVK